ncbi:MAG TPA: F0F1 ATP synthase subunit alpha, partial [Halothiobacillus sp.]|nr:F0F1 ATP synthase subunit alpha [Halothiobacillus sp.]
EMSLSLVAANEGYLDDVPVEKINDFEEALHAYGNSNAKELMDKIGVDGNYDDDIAAELKKVIEDFKANGVY